MLKVVVLPAWRASLRDGISAVRCGWQVIADGEWVQTFPTRRKAEMIASSLRQQGVTDRPTLDADGWEIEPGTHEHVWTGNFHTVVDPSGSLGKEST